jgi:hypothetical protein
VVAFFRHAVDDASPAARFCLLAICLVVSGVLHAVAIVLPWSTFGPFTLMGPADGRRPGVASRHGRRRIPAVLRIDFASPRVARPERLAKEENPRPAIAMPRSIPKIFTKPHSEPERLSGLPETALTPDVSQVAPAETEGRAVPLPQYFPAEKLTRQPELAEAIDDMLNESLEAGFRGHAGLRLFLDENGKVDKGGVLVSTLPIDIEGLIVRSVFKARYRPGEIDGVPVMSEMTVSADLTTAIELPAPSSAPVEGKAIPAPP